MTLSTHVLDLSRGAPAAGVAVKLYRCESESRSLIASERTNEDGRIPTPFGGALAAGEHELTFAAGTYFAEHARATFYDEIAVRFRIDDTQPHYHVPLLLSPYGYSTYRGS